jgi:hypothetical protein
LESTLSLSENDLAAEVGNYLGYGRGAASGDVAWTDKQERAIAACLRAGYARFATAHNWSFLRPSATLALASGASTLQLPPDFGHLEGPVRVTSPTGSARAFPQTGRARHRLSQDASRTGAPEECDVEPLRGPTASRGQRFQLVVYPAADQAYTLQANYSVHPNALSGLQGFPYGGAAHAETVREACLAAAEADLDGQAGVHEQKYQQQLAVSRQQDARRKPQHLGYNGDASGGYGDRDWRAARLFDGLPTVTFDGTEYA